MRLGLIIGIRKDPDAAMAKVHDLGLPTCQAFVSEIDRELADRLGQALEKYGIEATSLVVGGPGKEVWDFYQGPLTIGLVPRETRVARIVHIKKASDFAKKCGISALQTHCGFIPENPNDAAYKETVTAMREIAGYCKRNGQNFRYETGQETPITLVRTILDVGLDNQGVNFDLANLILYGKANPVDAIWHEFYKHMSSYHFDVGIERTNFIAALRERERKCPVLRAPTVRGVLLQQRTSGYHRKKHREILQEAFEPCNRPVRSLLAKETRLVSSRGTASV